jgi:predicted metal-dependent hydrolase
MKLLRQLLVRKAQPLPPPVVEEHWIDGVAVVITYKRHAAARRFTLRMAKSGAAFILTMPKRAGLADARRFAMKSENWMRSVLVKAQPEVKIIEGAIIPVRGIPTTITLTGKSRGLVHHDLETNTLHVPGAPEHVQRRLVDWLKSEATGDLELASQRYAAAMGVTYRKLVVRDQKSRWGSCTAEGVLSYSWRLVLAQPQILDYVAAHEVAHLQEMNHGPRFWRLVLKHCPHTRTAQAWLKANSAKLHAIA